MLPGATSAEAETVFPVDTFTQSISKQHLCTYLHAASPATQHRWIHRAIGQTQNQWPNHAPSLSEKDRAPLVRLLRIHTGNVDPISSWIRTLLNLCSSCSWISVFPSCWYLDMQGPEAAALLLLPV